MIYMLILSFITLLLGPLIFFLASGHKNILNFIDAFVLCGVLGLVAFHVLPESIAQGGIWAIVAALVGLLWPILSATYLKTGHCTIQKSIISLALLGLLAHAFLDGLALSGNSDGHNHGQGIMLAIAVVFHRLTEGFGIWRVTKPKFGVYAACGLLAADILATSTGFFAGTYVVNIVSTQTLVIFQALMAGLLMHVVFHRHHMPPLALKTHNAIKVNLSATIGALCAVVAVVLISFSHMLEHNHAHQGHHHEHHSHHTHKHHH